MKWSILIWAWHLLWLIPLSPLMAVVALSEYVLIPVGQIILTYGRFFDVTNYLRQKRDGLKGGGE